jgi:hypothetical protein
MGLPWFRMDSNAHTHEKIADLIDLHGVRGKAAAFVYDAAIGHCQGHLDTDNPTQNGLIRRSSLKFIYATAADARLLVEADLFVVDEEGWRIKNFNKRNGVGMAAQAAENEVRAAQSAGGKKGAAARWGDD